MAAKKTARKSKRGGASPRKRGKGGSTARKLVPEQMEQRHYDLIGLALIAVGLYLAFAFYLGSEGGRAADGIETGLSWLFGDLGYLAPAILVLVGIALVMRPLVHRRAPLNAGLVFVGAGMLLALAAETLGLGGGGLPVREGYFDPSYFTEHGGLVGEVLYWASATLFQRVGAHIIALLLIASGLLLLTGMPLVGLFRSGAEASRRAREATADYAQTARDLRRPSAAHTAPIAVEDEDEEEEIEFEERTETTEIDSLADNEVDAAYDDLTEDEEEIELADEDRMGDIPAPAAEVLPPDDDETEAEVTYTPMGSKRTTMAITESEEIDYRLPPKKLLKRDGGGGKGPSKKDLDATAAALLEALGHFGVEAKIIGTVTGPHVSRFELQLAPGTKVGKISQLKDDLAYALASTDIRILAPIPGKRAVGVEVPNAKRNMVRLGDIYQGRPKDSSPLVAWLGKDISGKAIWTDLAKMPHILIAGTTGSGKSGCVNAILSSMLLHSSPNELRLVLVDPKQVELNHYDSVPHLLTPVVTSPRLAANVLANLIGEMEARYTVMAETRARNIDEINKVRRGKGEAPLPHILCVIDELADLMMVAPGEVEDSIIRLAQKSRAVGIHLILATQRPSTDIITGTIKVNIPARIAFAVASQIDSRVILDGGGAESLLGQGDMLFRPVGSSKLQRVQGAFITEDEIAKIVSCWNRQGEPDFDPEMLEAKEPEEESGGDGEFDPDEDDLLDETIKLVIETDTASVSMVQRRLRVGYTRAGRLIDMLERRGVISGYEGSKPRQVLVGAGDLQRLLASGDQAVTAGEAAPEAAVKPNPPTEDVELEEVSN